MIARITTYFFFVFFPITMLLACSNVGISTQDHSNTIIARTFDFPESIHERPLFGAKGEENTTEVKLTKPDKSAHLITWENRFKFIGVSGHIAHQIVDGINEKGLYIGWLYLPSETSYPTYKPINKKPIIGVFDLGNYLLGTAKNVKQAITLLKQLQPIGQYIQMTPQLAVQFPLHLIIRDKSGHSALIEFIQGKVHIKTPAPAIITNAPNIKWQLNNSKQFTQILSQKDSTQKWNDQIMSGSGFYGLPGDFSSPSRFIRGNVIAKNSPVAHTTNEAKIIASDAINSLTVPLGMNPSPTLWLTMADLKNTIYYYRAKYDVINQNKHIYRLRNSSIDPITQPWLVVNLHSITPHTRKSFSKPIYSAQLRTQPKRKSQRKINLTHQPTQPKNAIAYLDHIPKEKPKAKITQSLTPQKNANKIRTTTINTHS